MYYYFLQTFKIILSFSFITLSLFLILRNHDGDQTEFLYLCDDD